MEGNQVQQDAEEFGVHLRAGGWRLGLLVARSVERGTGSGGTGANQYGSSSRRDHDTCSKVSAREFARMSNQSADRVLRYLDAWERAAVNLVVPAAEKLNPGTDVDLPDEESTPWTNFYSAGKASTDASVKRSTKAIARVAAEDTEFADNVTEAALENASPEAKREAFRKLAADPEVGGHDRTRLEAEVNMKQAADPIDQAHRRQARDDAKAASRGLGLVDAFLTMDRIARLGAEVAGHWNTGSDSWAHEEREEFRTRWSETLHELSIVSETITNLDAELSKILSGD